MAGRPSTPEGEAAIYAALCAAAKADAVAPTTRELRVLAGCHLSAVTNAIEAMERAGKVIRRGGVNTRSYFIPALGKGTEPPKLRRPGVFNLKRDPALTTIQRNTLSLARLAIARDGFARVCDLAREMGVNEGTMSGRLARIAERGHLRQRDDMAYVLATSAGHGSVAAPAARVEMRDGVRVTILPPAMAPGALVFRSALGFGGVALAGGGQQRIGKRA